MIIQTVDALFLLRRNGIIILSNIFIPLIVNQNFNLLWGGTGNVDPFWGKVQKG